MKCYNKKCKVKKCDILMKATCLSKITKDQAKMLENLYIELDGNYCSKCRSEMVQARHRKENIMLCTSCGHIKTKRQEYELIDIREVV